MNTYIEISSKIESDIKQGVIKIGDTIPSVPVLARQYEASTTTIRAVIKQLEKNGCVFRIEKYKGKGHNYRVLADYRREG